MTKPLSNCILASVIVIFENVNSTQTQRLKVSNLHSAHHFTCHAQNKLETVSKDLRSLQNRAGWTHVQILISGERTEGEKERNGREEEAKGRERDDRTGDGNRRTVRTGGTNKRGTKWRKSEESDGRGEERRGKDKGIEGKAGKGRGVREGEEGETTKE